MKNILQQSGPWLLLVVGIIALVFGIKNVLRAAASRSWPSVSGVIKDASVAANLPAAGSPRQTQDKTTTYAARLRYRFMVDGKNFEGSRISLEDYSASYQARVDEVVARYPKGGEVAVCYNPANPAECLLEPGVAFQTWLLPILGCVLLAAGSFWLRSHR